MTYLICLARYAGFLDRENFRVFFDNRDTIQNVTHTVWQICPITNWRNTMAKKLSAVRNATKEAAQIETTDATEVMNDVSNGRSQTIDLQSKRVTSTYFVRKSEGGVRHTLNTVFDFTNVSEAELYSLAMYAVKVKAQALWRSKDMDPLDPNRGFEKMDVKSQIVDQARAPKDPGVAARKALEKLTPEMLAQIIAEHAKLAKAE
jgi:hypothetical protein